MNRSAKPPNLMKIKENKKCRRLEHGLKQVQRSLQSYLDNKDELVLELVRLKLVELVLFAIKDESTPMASQLQKVTAKFYYLISLCFMIHQQYDAEHYQFAKQTLDEAQSLGAQDKLGLGGLLADVLEYPITGPFRKAANSCFAPDETVVVHEKFLRKKVDSPEFINKWFDSVHRNIQAKIDVLLAQQLSILNAWDDQACSGLP